MESLENKRKSNKNLIGHSKEKKQDLSVRTEEKIKTGKTEEKNHVDEIGSMVEGEVAKETVLPSWMCESEAYEYPAGTAPASGRSPDGRPACRRSSPALRGS